MQTREQVKNELAGLDKEGYLARAEMWTEDTATILAKEEVPDGLIEDHWKVIECMRQYYLEMGTVPPVRMLARKTGLSLRQMQGLFPSGLTRGAVRIAGLPRDAVNPCFLYP
ncbi:TusE/DsrC/DsvC family sulfur relay protein [Chloroflexota bacterium]